MVLILGKFGHAVPQTHVCKLMCKVPDSTLQAFKSHTLVEQLNYAYSHPQQHHWQTTLSVPQATFACHEQANVV